MSAGPPGAASPSSILGSARSGTQNGRSGLSTEKKNHIDEVLRRKAEAEKIIAARKSALIAEQNEKLRKIQEQRDRERKDRARQQAEKDLRRQKEALDRRQAYLDALNTKKETILARAHAATSRTAQNKKQTFAFGSSTPRDISYLQSIPKEQRQYDKKLMPTTGPAPPSPKASPPPSKPVRKSVTSPMTSSMYVPSGTSTRTPRTPSNRATPPRNNGKPNLMTQSMYSPITPILHKTAPKPHTSTPKSAKPVAIPRKNLPPAPIPRLQTAKKAEPKVSVKPSEQSSRIISNPRKTVDVKTEEKNELINSSSENPSPAHMEREHDDFKENQVIAAEAEKPETVKEEPQEQTLQVTVQDVVIDNPIFELEPKEKTLNDELSELLHQETQEADTEHDQALMAEKSEHYETAIGAINENSKLPHDPVEDNVNEEHLIDLGEVHKPVDQEKPLFISTQIEEHTKSDKKSEMIKDSSHIHEISYHNVTSEDTSMKENGNADHTDTSTSGDEEVASAGFSSSPPPPASSTPPSTLRPPTPEERKAELLAKLEQDEKEREARKARLAAIMSRTRKTDAGGDGDSTNVSPITSISSSPGGMSALERIVAKTGSTRINEILRREGSGANLNGGNVQQTGSLTASISDGALPGQVHDHIMHELESSS